jgi:hypothetical protein
MPIGFAQDSLISATKVLLLSSFLSSMHEYSFSCALKSKNRKIKRKESGVLIRLFLVFTAKRLPTLEYKGENSFSK